MYEERNKRLANGNSNGNVPQFSQLLKTFYLKAHPDLIRSVNSQYSEENDNSFQQLNEVISSIKECNSYPPQISKSLAFNLMNKDRQFTKVNLIIKTPGGDCRKLLSKTFQDFFQSAGIYDGGRFAWGKEYFPDEKE